MTRIQELEKLDGQLCTFRDIKSPTAVQLRDIQKVLERVEELNGEIVAEDVGGALRAIRAPVGNQGQPGTGSYTGDFNREFGEYLQAVYCASPSVDAGAKIGRFETGKVDRSVLYPAETRAPAGLAESTPSLGGFAVGSDIATEIFSKAHQATNIWKKCQNFPISSNSNSLKLPGIDETSRANGSRWGGIQSYWLEEAGSKTATKPTFMAVELSLKKLIGLCYATDELIQDAAALGAFIAMAFKQEFAFKLDDAVIRGTGAGQPLGILNGPSLVSTTRGSTGTICSTDVIGAYARMAPGSHANAEWFVNAECLPNLMAMTAAEAGYQAIWLPSGNVAGSPFQTLLGRPVNYVETASAEGTVGDLMFLDLSQYVTITKGGIQAAQSIHVNFSSDETAFRFVLRVDGQPLWNNVLTPYKGTDTVSPFVTVAT